VALRSNPFLQRQQLLFALDAPAVAAQIAVFADYSVAGDGDSYRLVAQARATALAALGMPIFLATAL